MKSFGKYSQNKAARFFKAGSLSFYAFFPDGTIYHSSASNAVLSTTKSGTWPLRNLYSKYPLLYG